MNFTDFLLSDDDTFRNTIKALRKELEEQENKELTRQQKLDREGIAIVKSFLNDVRLFNERVLMEAQPDCEHCRTHTYERDHELESTWTKMISYLEATALYKSLRSQIKTNENKEFEAKVEEFQEKLDQGETKDLMKHFYKGWRNNWK